MNVPKLPIRIALQIGASVSKSNHLHSFCTSSRNAGGQLSKNIFHILTESKAHGTYKYERVLESSQNNTIKLKGFDSPIINLCSNNYLGFADHELIQQAAINAMKQRGFGLASGRIICGTQDLHKQLERELSEFHRMDDCLLYTSCFDANAGIFEALLNENDAIYSDELNHASIIDGIRLSKVKRKAKYKHANIKDLEALLDLQFQQSVASASAGHSATAKSVNLIVTDGIFSMDGDIAPLKEIDELKRRYDNTYILVDECHSAGVIGSGAADYYDVKADIINGTLGKALGGASGGYTCSSQDVIELLRQKSRPYVFSNSLAPSICAASICALGLLKNDKSFQLKLLDNTQYFRQRIKEVGFKPLGDAVCPIVPVLIGNAHVAKQMADELLSQGVLIVNLGYPIVPINQARLRIQISATHTIQQLNYAVDMLTKVGNIFMK